MNPKLARAAATSPVWFPLLGLAAFLDFLFFPHYKRIGCDPAKEIADAAFKVMCG